MGSLIPDTLAGKDFTFSSIMKLTRFVASFFLLTQVVVPFIRAAPQNSRAAMDYEAVCASAAEAYSKAREEGKPAKRAAAISARTFFENIFDTFSDTGFPAGGLTRCAKTVDAEQARSTNGMVAYFNSAANADIEGGHPGLPQGQDCWKEVKQGKSGGVCCIPESF